MTRQPALLLGAFAGGALAASVLGANSLGIALGVGQVCFAAAVTATLLR